MKCPKFELKTAADGLTPIGVSLLLDWEGVRIPRHDNAICAPWTDFDPIVVQAI